MKDLSIELSEMSTADMKSANGDMPWTAAVGAIIGGPVGLSVGLVVGVGCVATAYYILD